MTISGWVIGVLSFLLAIHQYARAEKYKKNVRFEQKVEGEKAIGHQAENMTINNEGRHD